MELLSLPPPSLSRKLPRHSHGSCFLSGQPISPGKVNGCKTKRVDTRRRVRLVGRAPTNLGGFTPRAAIQAQDKASSKDDNVAFVAGATGKVGSRTVRELLKLGFQVRAGVRSVERADALVQSVKQLKLDDASATPAFERLELVECDLEKEGQIGSAIGNSSIVICCIGASEKEVLDVTGPYRIDYKATVNLIEAATASKVEQFFLVTSLGTNKIGFPAALLNLFWGVLCWKRKAEEALIASGLPYTIVRPGGMERPTDAFKNTHNLVVAEGDTYFGGLVSNLQVAELLAFMAKNRSSSYCKIVEVIAETTAPLSPMGELLSKIPSQRKYTPPPALKEKEDGEDLTPAASTTPPIEKAMVENGAGPISTSEPMPSPQSPFTAYDNLKPPSSPSPKAPVVVVSPKEVSSETSVKVAPARPSSPYFMYEDLKPPSSPSPSAPFTVPAAGSLEVLSTKEQNANESIMIEKTLQSIEEAKIVTPLSPFVTYDDLKPPSSPSPSKPVTAAAEAPPTPAIASEKSMAESAPPPPARPSSPYYMYEDLKPPTSPTPSKPN